MQTYPLLLNIISACWILFSVIWRPRGYWRRDN